MGAAGSQPAWLLTVQPPLCAPNISGIRTRTTEASGPDLNRLGIRHVSRCPLSAVIENGLHVREASLLVGVFASPIFPAIALLRVAIHAAAGINLCVE